MPRFALHVQAAWRLVDAKGVLVGFDDELEPPHKPLWGKSGELVPDATRCDELWSEQRARLAKEKIVVRAVAEGYAFTGAG